ncbi:MAG: hypothetical protein HGA31_03690 [Candidatus Moranbacteria bacterium]|nr:hypothetical protein [Candidatus Moranbacteria bacterium]
MEKKTKELSRSIEDLEEELKRKKRQLESLQKECDHVWPEKWEERVEKDFSVMSGAFDRCCRESEPGLKIRYVKYCERCGKERKK